MRALAIALLAACSAYDKDLGGEPFLCGPTEPRCPMDYSCQHDAQNNSDICVASGSVDGNFSCADDSAIEPNDTISHATMTTVDSANSYEKDGLAICPPGDKDLFSLVVTSTASVQVLVAFDPSAAPLTAIILNAGGIPIAYSATDPAMPGTADASAAGMLPSMYYVQVSGPATPPYENNYKLTITVN